MVTSVSVRFVTKTVFTCDSSPSFVMASSTIALRRIVLPPRLPSFAVKTHWELQSRMRCASASALKPAKTTEWGAPRRAQASITTAASTTIGM